MDRDIFLTALHGDMAALVDVARLGLDAPVPSCPGWIVANLVIHLGTIYRDWIAVIDARGAAWPLDIRRRVLAQTFPELIELFERGEKGVTAWRIPDGLMEWFAEGAERLQTVLRAADLDAPFWQPPEWPSFGEQRNILYLHTATIETAVHRWDAQLAHHCTTAIDRSVAEVGIDQALTVMIPANRWFVQALRKEPVAQGRGETYLLRQMDGERIWRVRFDGDATMVEGGMGEADVTLAGSTSDLLLFLWHRIAAERLDVAGDRALLDRYFELAPPL